MRAIADPHGSLSGRLRRVGGAVSARRRIVPATIGARRRWPATIPQQSA